MKQNVENADQLSVVRLSKTDWRVSDRDGELLGYIERQHADRYELVWMTDPMRWGYIDSFDEAIEAFGASVRFTGEEFAKRVKDPNPTHSVAAHPRRDTWVKPKGRPHVA